MSKKVSLARVDKELLRATTNMNWNLTAVDEDNRESGVVEAIYDGI